MEQIEKEAVISSLIKDVRSLRDAQSLLYEFYICHLSWEIAYSNPSNIKIQHFDDLTILTDDYDDLSTWFSIKKNNKLIACARLCHEDTEGLLEIERYNNAKKALKYTLAMKHTLKIVELNREAILPKYSNEQKIYLLLLKKIFEYCLDNNFSILTTCNISEWVRIYDVISFKSSDELTFKFFDSDPRPVRVYVATPRKIQKLINNIKILI